MVFREEILMFSKDTETLESFVGSNTQFKGEMNMKGTLRLDGAIEGCVNADKVILSEMALVKGDIAAQKIVIGGRVEGNLRAKELVEIQSKGKVIGEIFTDKLSVAEGAEINGNIKMKSKEPKILDFESQGSVLAHADKSSDRPKSSKAL
jgi:cytoskeletal protein CcmA (bactofilin family)